MIVEVTYLHWLDKYELESVTVNPYYHRPGSIPVINPSQFPFAYPSGFVIHSQSMIESVYGSSSIYDDRKQRFRVFINLDKDFSNIENVMIYKVSKLVKAHLRNKKLEEIGI